MRTARCLGSWYQAAQPDASKINEVPHVPDRLLTMTYGQHMRADAFCQGRAGLSC